MASSSTFKEVAKKFRLERNKKCEKCLTEFNSFHDYERHIRNRKNISCRHCNRSFCTNNQMEKHLRTISLAKDDPIDYERCLHEKTGFEDDPRFQELIATKQEYICDHVREYKHYSIINKKISTDFTYGDLDDLLTVFSTKEQLQTKRWY